MSRGGANGQPERRVGRYSRFVNLMKVALPALALLLTLLVIAWPRLQSTTSDLFAVSFGTLSGRNIDSQRLVNARYHGTDSDNQPFMVTADLAEETAPGSRVVRLTSPKADLTFDDGSWVMMTARTGQYMQDTNDLDLSGGVDLFHDEGYEMHTPAMTVNLRAGTVTGTQPVTAQGPLGSLTAEGFTYDRDAGRVEFTGRAKVLMRPGATPPAKRPDQRADQSAKGQETPR
ncbi:MAG: LPS export ABC transporter periplasmic protein LptC [Rhodospirillaceae bacterium]